MSTLRDNFVNGLRILGAHPRLAPLHAVYLSAPTVSPSLPFAAHELLHRPGLRFYKLRENDRRVAIRHAAGAPVIVAEVFKKHDYEPRPELEDALGPPGLVLDLGGNIGLFGLYAAARWPNAQIMAFEPDPESAAIQKMTIDANGWAERWQLVEAAASNRDGKTSFVAGLNAVSHVADATTTETTIDVSMIDVLPRIAEADLLKMDIEGGEWEILGDPRFREAPPRAVVMEYHPEGCPTSSPRLEAEHALTAAGLQVRPSIERDDGHGMLWAWRQ
jgi:FkbM family methyltransferase